MDEAERKVVNVNGVKLSSSAVRISGPDIVDACIVQGTYEDKAYTYVSSKLVGTPKERSKYFFIERDSFLDGNYDKYVDMYWSLRDVKRLDIIFFSVRYSKVLYIKIVGQVPTTTVDEEVVISRGYSYLFGLIKKKDVVENIPVDVADVSVIKIIKELIIQRFYEEKKIDNI